MDERILKSLRGALWEEAKGKLNALEHTYWGEAESLDAFQRVKENFIAEVEDNGLVD